jgi:hypothetical protein
VHDIVVSGNQVSGNFQRGILIVRGNNGANNVVDGIEVVGNGVRTNGDQGILVSGGTLSENAIISDILIDANTNTL